MIAKLSHMIALRSDITLILIKGTLGDLKVQHISRDVVLFSGFFHNSEDVAQLKVKPGDVYRDRNQLFSLISHLHVVPADALDNEGIHQMDQVELLQSGYEITRREHAHLGIDPAHKRLVAADFSGLNTDNRLVKDLYVFPFDCLINMVNDVLLLAQIIS